MICIIKAKPLTDAYTGSMTGGNYQKPIFDDLDEEDVEDDSDDSTMIDKTGPSSSEKMQPSLFAKSQQPPVYYVSGLVTPPFVYKDKEEKRVGLIWQKTINQKIEISVSRPECDILNITTTTTPLSDEIIAKVVEKFSFSDQNLKDDQIKSMASELVTHSKMMLPFPIVPELMEIVEDVFFFGAKFVRQMENSKLELNPTGVSEKILDLAWKMILEEEQSKKPQQ